MDSQVAIYLLIFITVIAVLCISRNLQHGMLLAVIVTNIFAVYSYLNKNIVKKKCPKTAAPAPTPSNEVGNLRESAPQSGEPDQDAPDQMPFYGKPETEVADLPDPEEGKMNIRKYGQYRGGYADTSARVRSTIQFRPTGPNDRIIEINQAHGDRARMSQVGSATKTSDYYKYHFGDEFEGEEKKEWWGQVDYDIPAEEVGVGAEAEE